MQRKLVENIKHQLKRIEFFRFKIAPLIREWQFIWKKHRAEKKDFIYIDDLKTEAASRNWKYQSKASKVLQHSFPSKCLSEDALTIVRKAAIIRRKHDRRNEDRDFLDRVLFSNLLSITRYPVYETFICEVPEVYISAPDGPVLTSNFEALPQSSRLEWERVLMERVPNKEKYLAGKYVSLLGWSGNNYGHWLVDILVRATLVLEDCADLFFLVADSMPRFKRESLELMGIPQERIIPLTPGWYKLENLVLCHAAQRSMIPKKQHLLALRERLVTRASGSRELACPNRLVYLSRTKARRRISNEDEIMPVLKEHGFVRVYAEDLSFPDQVRLFAETKVLLGPHGTGLNNIFLCCPGAKLIELYNPVRYNTCVRGVANLLDHEHWFMYGENVNPEYDMTVSPKKLEKLLAYVFDQGDYVEAIY